MNAPVTFDGVWEELEQIVGHDELCKSGQSDDIARVVLRGWDVSSCLLRVDLPERGIWPAPHPLVLHDLDLTAHGLVPVLHPAMSASEIEAGIWRQLRIFPDAEPWRRQGVRGEAPRDPFRPHERMADGLADNAGNRSLPSEAMVDGETRNPIIRSLLFATPRDAADYLVAKLASQPEIGRFLLAKDFKHALRCEPTLWADDWPRSIVDRLQNQGLQPPPLGPFAFLAALACLSRLAQNLAAHIVFAYQDHGPPMHIANYRLAALACGGDAAPAPVRKLAGHALLQTTALLPPTTVFDTGDGHLGLRWSAEVACVIEDVFAQRGRSATLPLTHSASIKDAAFVRDGLMAHPALPPKNGSTQNHAFRVAPYATFYGTTPKLHAAVGAFQIRSQVEKWMESMPRVARLSTKRKSAKDGRPFSQGQAAAALLYLWLETSCPQALPAELGSITLKPNFDHHSPSIPPETIDDLIGGARFGEELGKHAKEVIRLLAGAQVPPWAWYHPLDWLNNPVGDLAGFDALQRTADQYRTTSRQATPRLTDDDMSRIDPRLLERIGLDKGLRAARCARRRMQAAKDPASERPVMSYAERAAMTVSATATDQIWRLMLQSPLQKSGA